MKSRPARRLFMGWRWQRRLFNLTTQGLNMSIKHTDFDAIKHLGLHTVTLPSEIIREFKNSHAIHIWCYLQTMSKDWKPRKAEILSGCHMTDHAYRPAMRYLKNVGLVFDEDARDKKGRIQKKTLNVLAIPRNMDDFLIRCRKVNAQGFIHDDDLPHDGNPHTVDSPQCGYSSPLSSDQCLSSDQLVSTCASGDAQGVGGQENKPDNKAVLIDYAFGKIWAAWPTKRNKKRARITWQRLCRGKSLKFVEGLAEYIPKDIQHRMAVRGFAEMHLSSYLNGERYNDES